MSVAGRRDPLIDPPSSLTARSYMEASQLYTMEQLARVQKVGGHENARSAALGAVEAIRLWLFVTLGAEAAAEILYRAADKAACASQRVPTITSNRKGPL